jgi:hypothetical protein
VEYAWAKSSANAKVVFDRSGATIFELTGPLDRGACAADIAAFQEREEGGK